MLKGLHHGGAYRNDIEERFKAVQDNLGLFGPAWFLQNIFKHKMGSSAEYL